MTQIGCDEDYMKVRKCNFVIIEAIVLEWLYYPSEIHTWQNKKKKKRKKVTTGLETTLGQEMSTSSGP